MADELIMDEALDTLSTDESGFATPDTSTASGSSAATLSDLGVSSVVSCKEKSVARKWCRMEKKKKKKMEKKKKKNKISKDDFSVKLTEFKVWLSEVKKVNFDNLVPKQQKDYFKKFVKKWNAGKLDKKYYRGVLWAVGTPDTQTNWNLPSNIEVTPGSVGEDILEEKYSRTGSSNAPDLGTFGKSTGAKMLRELRSTCSDKSEAPSISNDTRINRSRNENVNLLPLQQMFLPPDQNVTKNYVKVRFPSTNHCKVKSALEQSMKSDEDEWPAPPSPYSNTVEFEHQSQGQQTKLMHKMSDEDDKKLPPYPRTSSQQTLQCHTSKLLKVDVPIIKPLQSINRKPPTAPKPHLHKPRPVSCVESALRRPAPPPPKRSLSSENVKRQSWCAGNQSSQLASSEHGSGPAESEDGQKCRMQSGLPEKSVNSSSVKAVSQNSQSEMRKPLIDVRQQVSCSRNAAAAAVMNILKKEVVGNVSGNSNEMKTGQVHKRQLTMSETQKCDNKKMQVDAGVAEDRSVCESEEPSKKLARHDSYASQLSSASYAVFQTLNSTKGNMKSNQLTPVRIISNFPHQATPELDSNKAKMPSDVDNKVLTPGKSSVSTNL